MSRIVPNLPSCPNCLDWRRVFGVCLALVLLSCSRPATVAQTAPPAEPSPEPIPHSREANDVARFLAGLPGAPDSPFLELEKDPAWIEHQKELDKAWTGIQTRTLPSMHEFQTSELSNPQITRSMVFYPFSGPDALMLTVFFPKNPNYLMVALEPPGTLPTIKQLSRNLPKTLAGVRATVSSELERSFFITRQMDSQFRGQVTDGLLSPIAQLLVRSGHTILGYRMVRIDASGKVAARGEIPQGESPNRGVEIEFQTDADQSLHRLSYFSLNLADDHLSQNKGFLAYLGSLPGGVTSYFKATSYMTHHAEFSVIRDQVLARSTAILQDDSGIPYRYFRDQPWHVQLYGDYNRPYGSFRWLEQPDLRKAYGEPDRKPLPFQIGYGFRRIPSNLLFANKAATRKD